jgi:hypothetical protein
VCPLKLATDEASFYRQLLIERYKNNIRGSILYELLKLISVYRDLRKSLVAVGFSMGLISTAQPDNMGRISCAEDICR